MQILLTIPDEFMSQALPQAGDPAQAALEAIAVEGYREGRLTESEVRRMVGYATRMEVHRLLADHDVPLNFTMADVQQEIAACDAYLRERGKRTSAAEAALTGSDERHG